MSSHYHRRAREIARNEGGRGLFAKVIQKLKSSTYETNGAIWFRKLLAETGSEMEAPDVRITLAAAPEFESWLESRQAEFPWIRVEREALAARNDAKLAFAARSEDAIIGHLRVAVKDAYVLDYDAHLRLPCDVALVQDTFVLPEFRGRGIAKSMISSALKHLREDGYSSLFCHIPKWNVASIAAYEGLGFQRVGYVRFLRIFKLKLYTRRPQELIGGA